MAARDTGSEKLIKDTAKKIFFAEGKLHASTQDIADAAGVTRTLVNYYFRSKEILFEQVFHEGLAEMGKAINDALSADLPFKEKVIHFIGIFSAEMAAYPFREAFMISEINSNAFVPLEKKPTSALKNFLKEVQEEMDRGTIKKMKPVNFMMNLFALMAYPVVLKPLYKNLFEVNDLQYSKLLKERQDMIIDLLFL